ncbi:hypothetical protein E5345_04180 [Propionibacterium sp. NM47_B9-13]|uniref:Uncharacterized protein n=1 Tax=Cutibacterium modestum HL044PA1 TaxID=765109 RepID=A0ABP2K389_9ACTN|nr:hypothetical protein HMPREF9621_00273 [Cutibacterium modestum HL037PA2]EFS91236.1 hypothetical protein HMPREF9607_02527 [Cutibacterium modestum HL044PA1]EFT16751.1 hypothetical protein HMPREF9622_00295 [Cutibacterium modestum HL037PA3]EGG27254.1 hypothetical protein PA08_1498 [Cutibacterium modestum P08]REB74709.1 hypothetical protein CP877_02330 [Cutibacterium modestum]TGY29231.1 hypothetical protein E5345_04180 [Propionibacterium sp. NM47_B9-13]
MENALLLSNRVVVVSPRPAYAVADFPMKLDWTRTQGDLQLRELHHKILGALALRTTRSAP